jgi:hypothetical protein
MRDETYVNQPLRVQIRQQGIEPIERRASLRANHCANLGIRSRSVPKGSSPGSPLSAMSLLR